MKPAINKEWTIMNYTFKQQQQKSTWIIKKRLVNKIITYLIITKGSKMREKIQKQVKSSRCLSHRNSIGSFFLNIAKLKLDLVLSNGEMHGYCLQVVFKLCYHRLNTTTKTQLHTRRLCINHIRVRIVTKLDWTYLELLQTKCFSIRTAQQEKKLQSRQKEYAQRTQ